MLTVKKAQRNSATYCAPVQHTSTVTLYLYNPGFASQSQTNLPFHSLSILNLDPITFTVETSWKDGAAASVAGKINELMSNKFVRMLSGPEFFQPVATDSWSQQVVEKGNPISVKLKFRAYYEPDDEKNGSATCSQSYLKVIRFFTYLTSPPKQYSLSSATIGVIANVAKNISNTGEKIGTAVKGRPDDENIVTATVKYTLAALGETAGLDLPVDHNHAQRGQYTLCMRTPDFGNDDLDWIVKSVNATPSQQFVIAKNVVEKEVPMPLWVDFEVDLETNMAPSNALASRFFSKKNYYNTSEKK